MIDLHAHILPGLDDGPRDIRESVDMCMMAADDGIHTIVATPHTGNGTYDNPRPRVLAAVSELNETLQGEGVGVRILPGADIHVHPHLDRLIEGRETCTVNDAMRYIMVEFPRHVIPPNYIEWLSRLTGAGFIPIFTHPERNMAVRNNMAIVSRWVREGGLVQVTAMSLTGEFGSEIQKCTLKLLKRCLVHVIASDAHSERRPPILSRARAVASSVLGPDTARRLVEDYPSIIIAGSAIDTARDTAKKRGFFSRLIGV
jgi:protein-tyrosine phosphatase